MDPDPSHFFFIKAEFQSFCLIFFTYFILDDPLRNQKIFTISFFNSSDLGFGSLNKIFFADLGWYFTLWIQIHGSTYFYGSGSRSWKPKSCWSNRSGSSALMIPFVIKAPEFSFPFILTNGTEVLSQTSKFSKPCIFAIPCRRL